MKHTNNMLATVTSCLIALILSGCATNWIHPKIPDKKTSARQLTIDDGYCTMVSVGAAPMPPISQSNGSTTSYVTGSGSTYNTTTGQRTTGTYTGQVTSIPSGGFGGGFASGFASGASTGAAIAAAIAQGKIYNACMSNKGWVDADTLPTAKQSTVGTSLPQPPSPLAYSDPKEEWQGSIDEFLSFYPSYKSKNYHALLDKRVRSVANNKELARGPLYLLTAHEELTQEGIAPKSEESDLSGLRAIYVASVKGDSRQQSALALAYLQRKDDRMTYNPKRAAFWSRESALQGNPTGQLGYGITLFRLGDKINGYRWVEFAGKNGAKTDNILSGFRAEMNEGELLTVQRQN